MERLIILLIWVIGINLVKNANTKKGKSQTKAYQHKRKNFFSTLKEEIEKEMQRQEESQRQKGPAQRSQAPQPVRRAQPTMVSDLPAGPAPTMMSDRPLSKTVGLDVDIIGGDEEIGGINEANISLGTKYNNLNLDLKKDLVKGLIYSEILSEPKALKNMKRRALQ